MCQRCIVRKPAGKLLKQFLDRLYVVREGEGRLRIETGDVLSEEGLNAIDGLVARQAYAMETYGCLLVVPDSCSLRSRNVDDSGAVRLGDTSWWGPLVGDDPDDSEHRKVGVWVVKSCLRLQYDGARWHLPWEEKEENLLMLSEADCRCFQQQIMSRQNGVNHGQQRPKIGDYPLYYCYQ